MKIASAAGNADTMAPLKIFLSAGEASGEHYGARLMDALRQKAPATEFFGLGGPAMEQRGLRRIVRTEDVAVMGITEVISHMPHIYAQYRKLKLSLRREKPDIALLVDFPDVNLRLAQELHRLGIPVVYFVSPQLWAWKRRRIRRVQRFVTRMLVIFPFEENYYKSRSVDAEFVGHPLAELDPPSISREAFARENGLNPSKTWIGLLPGSRRKELEANLPPMLEAASLMGSQYEYILPVAPGLRAEEVSSAINEKTGGLLPIYVVHDARAALFHARASVVASGTATVQAALIGNPFLIVYRMSKISYAVARRVVKVPHVGMANLIAGRQIVPELLQDDFSGANVVKLLNPLIEDGHAREEMKADLRGITSALRKSTDDRTSIERVAEITLGLIANRKGPPVQQTQGTHAIGQKVHS
jgi:lipid-A-disaccharide synthase